MVYLLQYFVLFFHIHCRMQVYQDTLFDSGYNSDFANYIESLLDCHQVQYLNHLSVPDSHWYQFLHKEQALCKLGLSLLKHLLSYCIRLPQWMLLYKKIQSQSAVLCHMGLIFFLNQLVYFLQN